MADRFPSRFAVANLQLSLSALGYPCGRADGLVGPQLIAALDAYRATLPGAAPAPQPEPKPDPWPKDREADMVAFYGERGDPANMVSMTLPRPLRLYSVHGPEIGNLYVNRRIADPLYSALKEVAALPDEMRDEFELDVTGGVFNNRKKTGGNGWSTHAYGAAIDIAINKNPYGAKPVMPVEVIRIFERHGAEWGGDWKTPDGHHFQGARS